MKVAEAAAVLGIATDSVNSAIRRKRLDATRLPYGPRGTIDVPMAAVEKYRENNLGKRGSYDRKSRSVGND